MLARIIFLCYHKSTHSNQQIQESGERKMFIERTWEDGKVELFSMDAGTVLRMHEGYASCWHLEVDAGGKTYVLLKNTSITIIQQKYAAVKEQWVGNKTVVAVTEE